MAIMKGLNEAISRFNQNASNCVKNLPSEGVFTCNFDDIEFININGEPVEIIRTPFGEFTLRFIARNAIGEFGELIENSSKEEFPYNDLVYILAGRTFELKIINNKRVFILV